jgi:ParB family chromosome partitioning protein
MSQNPFNRALDWALQGKRARVSDGQTTYVGWIDRIHHSRGSVLLHDATIVETDGTGEPDEELASVFIRNPGTIVALKPGKRIKYCPLEDLTPFPDHPQDFETRDTEIERCARNGYAGSFPVVRENGQILNGHKRIEAARQAGLAFHPVEVLSVTDEQAHELYRIAHRTADSDSTSDDNTASTDTDSDSDTASGDDAATLTDT